MNKKQLHLGAFALIATVAVIGCATLGIGNQPPEQASLEAAALLMAFEYDDIRDDPSLSAVDIAHRLLEVGDRSVQEDGFTSFTALIQSRINDVTNGKFDPKVYVIYKLTVKVLERLEAIEPAVPDDG